MRATDPVQILRELIRCPSVTPEEAGALTVLEGFLKPLGFTVERPVFSEEGTADVENLYARLGSEAPHVMFAGHTDVVLPGNADNWTHPPFAAEVANGMMYGRGAVDMKGGIACFVAAIGRLIEAGGKPNGSISLLITGDEEGPSLNGTDKLLKWAAEKGEAWDGCVVGEPTNPNAVGDAMKNGRRGSLSGRITVTGVQGHSAYPQLADNPVHALMGLLDALLLPPLDEGSDQFQPSDIQVTSADVGNKAVNVIPADATAAFNVRFNDLWNGDTLKAEIMRRLNEGAEYGRFRAGRDEPVKFSVEWVGRVSPVFVTRDNRLTGTLSGAIEAVTGRQVELSTNGGTSDARFIKDYCPVVDFGLVGKTMHQIDERVSLADLETLTAIYQRFLESWFR
ncbi:MAG: succinyl-diaminopimelate desuccinylase [Salaquimonas sp.]|jgi:succinyl-diaminopimelate desuccinylase|nr:succinyl-diaminopimelate desuccinylase [Salaquimonas sp.]